MSRDEGVNTLLSKLINKLEIYELIKMGKVLFKLGLYDD